MEKNEDVEMADPAVGKSPCLCAESRTTQESALWGMESGWKVGWWMTNRRNADLKNGRYVNSPEYGCPYNHDLFRNRGAEQCSPPISRTEMLFLKVCRWREE